MKVQFTEQESARVLARVQWTVYAEAVVDGDVVVSTPHNDADELLSNLVVTSSVTRAHPADKAAPHVYLMDVLHLDDALPLDTRTEVLVVMWGVVDEDPSKVIEWRGYLSPKDWEVQEFDVLDDTSVCLSVPFNGFGVVKSLYSRSLPRRWRGVHISFNAVGVQRALDEFIL